MTMRQRLHSLRAAAVPLGQTAAAAGIAWAIAHNLFGHPRPFFAPIAATIVLGLAPGRRTRRAIQMVIGVAVGIAVGDLLIALIGPGAIQIALIVLLAMSASLLLSGGPLVTTQAVTSAVLVAALPSTNAIPTRFVDALVGGAVGLLILVAVPRNPVRLVQRVTDPLFDDLARVLDAVALGLEQHDTAVVERALARARAASDLAGRFRQELEAAHETVHLAPGYWSSREDVEHYVDAAAHVDYAVRNIRVLARSSITAVEHGVEIPPALPRAIRDLAIGIRELQNDLEGEDDGGGIEAALRAAGGATLVLDEAPSLQVSVIVGLMRSITVDLLRAHGIDRQQAVEQVRAAAERLQAERAEAERRTAGADEPE